MAVFSCRSRSLVLLVTFAIAFVVSYAPGTFADPDPASIQSDAPHSSASDAAAAAAAAAAASSSSSSSSGTSTGPVPPPVVQPPPPPIVPPGISKGINFELNKHFGINAGAGLGGLFGGLFPGFEAGVPPIGDGGGYLGLPYFLGPQYIPQTWWGSALAAKGDLLFPIAIFLFAVVGVILTIKFLLALLVPFLAKKWAIAEALTGAFNGGGRRLRRSADDGTGSASSSSVPQDASNAHQARVDELTGKVLPATEGQRFQGQRARHHEDRFAEPDRGHDSDNDDSDGDFDG